MAKTEGPTVFGVILAGGAGSRLGGADKAALQVGGISFLARARAALKPAVRIAVAGGARVEAAAADGLPVLADPIANAGPLAGLAAGLAWAEAGGADWLISAPVDAPFLAANAYERLLAAVGDDIDIVIAAADGRSHWLAAAWRPSLAMAARNALNGEDLAVAGFVRAHRWKTLALKTAPNMFLNVNAPADLAAANALAEKEGR